VLPCQELTPGVGGPAPARWATTDVRAGAGVSSGQSEPDAVRGGADVAPVLAARFGSNRDAQGAGSELRRGEAGRGGERLADELSGLVEVAGGGCGLGPVDQH